MASKKLVALISVGCLATGLLIGKAMCTPKRAYTIWDSNRDGVVDLVIEKRNGDKITLYGSELGDHYKVYERESNVRKQSETQ